MIGGDPSDRLFCTSAARASVVPSCGGPVSFDPRKDAHGFIGRARWPVPPRIRARRLRRRVRRGHARAPQPRHGPQGSRQPVPPRTPRCLGSGGQHRRRGRHPDPDPRRASTGPWPAARSRPRVPTRPGSASCRPTPTRRLGPARASSGWPPTTTSPCSAGARSRSTTRSSAASPAAPCRPSTRCSSPGPQRRRVSTAWSSNDGPSCCASGLSTSYPAPTSPPSRREPSCTRGCSPHRRSSPFSPIFRMSGRTRPWPWCTPAFPPTRSRAGPSPTPTGTWRTTARSTPSRATATGCAPGRPSSPATCSPAISSGSSRSSRPAPATRPASTRPSSCCTWAGARSPTPCS